MNTYAAFALVPAFAALMLGACSKPESPPEALRPVRVLRMAPTQLAQQAQQAALDTARTDMQVTETELKRYRELREKNFISPPDLERHEAVLEAARARFEAALSPDPLHITPPLTRSIPARSCHERTSANPAACSNERQAAA